MTKKIIILGGGETGVGAAILAQKKGFDVFVSDFSEIKPEYKQILIEYSIDFEEKTHEKAENLAQATPSPLEKAGGEVEIIKSPGIPNTIPLIQKAIAKGIPIISEIEFAGRYTDAKMICITGTNGKTTVASLIYHILKSAGLNVGLGGNIGRSFARQVAEERFDYYVLELSSFQLDEMYDFKADIAILLNITTDHLDRYDYDMQKYVDAKMRIIRNQKANDVFIYWADDPLITKEIEKLKPQSTLYAFGNASTVRLRSLTTLTNNHLSAYTDGEKLFIHTKEHIFDMKLELLALQGMHNIYNSLASGIVAKLLDVSDKNLRQALSDFKGVPHRLEKTKIVRGVQYINDSKATNVNSCWYALQSFRSKIVLILGGIDKGNDYTEIEELVRSKVRALIFLGKDNSLLHSFFDGKIDTIRDVSSMQEAVNVAYELAESGDTVLLSPCCASFDLFRDYEDRGNQFKECVGRL